MSNKQFSSQFLLFLCNDEFSSSNSSHKDEIIILIVFITDPGINYQTNIDCCSHIPLLMSLFCETIKLLFNFNNTY